MFTKSFAVAFISQVVVITLVTASSFAQPSGRGGGFSSMMGGGGMSPDYMLRDIQKFNLALQLSEDQLVIVEQILRDYDESFREASDASREGIGSSFSSMRGSEDDPERQRRNELRTQSRELRDKLESAKKLNSDTDTTQLQKELSKKIDSIREEMQQQRTDAWQSPERQAAMEEMALLMQDQLRLKHQMKVELEGDLVAILTEEQLALWPALERQLIRDRLLQLGRLSGESVDIMALVEQQEYEDAVLIDILPAINEWDVHVSAALEARDLHMIETQGTLMSSMHSTDTSATVGVLAAQSELAEAVRDINDNAVESISLLLSADKSTLFNNEAKLKGYPRIYRTTRVERAYAAAKELEDLEADILQAIIELEEAMLIELAYSNEQIYLETHRWESQEQIDRVNRFSQRMSGGSSERAESPIRIASNAKSAIEDNFISQLKMLLTEEQIKTLGGLETNEERDEARRNENAESGRGNRGGGWGDSGGGREEFMNRFDKDGNGEISESEREAIRDHFRSMRDQNGGQGFGNRGGGGGAGNGGGRPE